LVIFERIVRKVRRLREKKYSRMKVKVESERWTVMAKRVRATRSLLRLEEDEAKGLKCEDLHHFDDMVVSSIGSSLIWVVSGYLINTQQNLRI